MFELDVFNTCVTIITALLGLAYPIVIQLISEERFSSENILDFFEKHWKHRGFTISLKVSVIILLLNIILIKLIGSTEYYCLSWILDIITTILFLSTCNLIWFFFSFISLVKTFYRAPKLLEYFVEKKNKILIYKEYKNVEALTDLLLWAIENQRTPIAKDISSYIYTLFSDYRKTYNDDTENKAIIYPDKFYWLVYNVLEKMLKQENNSLLFLEERTAGGVLLLGELKSQKISEETYSWMWRCVVLCVKYNRTDLVFTNWKRAHQFLDYNLPRIHPKVEYENHEIVTTNKKEIEIRDNERNRFLEFYYAMGGLLVFTQDYKTLKKIFSYSQSIPPSYPLLPNHMNKIFEMFFYFLDPYDTNFPWITTKYYFPGLDGTQADSSIKGWICRYIAVLYIRQYHIQTNYTFQKPIALPSPPKDIADKNLWIQNIPYFKNQIEKILEDKDLMTDLGYKIENERYLSFFDELLQVLRQDLKNTIVKAKPDEDKIQLFLDTSADILTKSFNEFKDIRNSNKERGDNVYTENHINGEYSIIDKKTYLDDDVHHLNYHTYLAEAISGKIKETIAESFVSHTTTSYIINEEKVFSALDKMELNDNHIIVVFGFENMNYYKSNLNIKNLTNDNYKETKLVLMPNYIRGITRAMFVLEKSNLPIFEYKEIDEHIISLYGVKEIIKEYKVYGAVTELNSNKNLLQKLQGEGHSNLNEQLWQGILFDTIIAWKNDSKIVKIELKSNFDNQTKPNDINDIKKF